MMPTLALALAAASGCDGIVSGSDELHLSGLVLDARGSPIAGATVRVEAHLPSGSRSTEASAVTSEAGSFTLSVEPTSGYAVVNCFILWIEVEAEGYYPSGGRLSELLGEVECGPGQASLTFELRAERPEEPLEVLVIVDGPLTDEDDHLMELLSWAGHGVAYRMTRFVTPDDDFGDADVIVVAESATSLGAEYRDVPLGIVVLRGELWPDYHLSEESAPGASAVSFTVADADHPVAVAAGLVGGSNSISSSDASLWTASGLGPGGLPIAYAEDAPVLFTYEAASELSGGNAAAGRRVGLGFDPLTALNALGEEVLLAAVYWAGGAPDPDGPHVERIDGPDRLIGSGR